MRRIMRKRKDQRVFRQTALKTKKINAVTTVRRGGIRL